MDDHTKRRRRDRPFLSLQDRLSAWASQIRETAAKLEPGPERDALLKKAGQADAAVRLNEWANSPGLKPPK
jgi:hypothetical protein